MKNGQDARSNVANVEVLPLPIPISNLREIEVNEIGNWQHWIWQYFHIGNNKHDARSYRRINVKPPGCGFTMLRRPLTTVAYQSSAVAPPGRVTVTSIAFASCAVSVPAGASA